MGPFIRRLKQILNGKRIFVVQLFKFISIYILEAIFKTVEFFLGQ